MSRLRVKYKAPAVPRKAPAQAPGQAVPRKAPAKADVTPAKADLAPAKPSKAPAKAVKPAQSKTSVQRGSDEQSDYSDSEDALEVLGSIVDEEEETILRSQKLTTVGNLRACSKDELKEIGIALGTVNNIVKKIFRPQKLLAEKQDLSTSFTSFLCQAL